LNQQDEEKLIIEQFRKYYPEFPKGKLVKSESPDFILKINPKRSIGIELTRLDEKGKSVKEKIESTINRKESKLSLYNKNQLRSLWLIIHTDGFNENKFFNLFNKLNQWNFPSKFNSVFLFDLFSNKIYPLVVRP